MRTETFYYDNSGYYGYVLFSGTNAELHGLLNALGRGDKEHGFGWHRWGRSFRPADNGTVYDYYIRLRSKTGTKPAPGVVEAFLKEALPPRETLTGESERELALDDAPEATAAAAPASDDPPLWANDFLSRMEAMHLKNVDSLTQKMSEELLQLRGEVGDIAEARLETNRLQASLDRSREDLAKKEAELQERKSELETLRKSPRAASYNQQMQEEKNKAEKAANKLRADIKKLREEKNHNISQLKSLLKKAEEDRDQWQKQFKEVSESFAELTEGAPTETEDGADDGVGETKYENDLIDIVEGAFPQLELLSKSLERLPSVPNFRPIMKLLHDVHTRKLRGERIPTTDWSEVRFSKSWRLYFCNKSNLPNDRKLAIIGNKNTQKADLRWLRANPPESCL